jgi:hypothetical protein
MWRTFASLGLVVFAIAWSALAFVLIFMVAPGLWEALLGRSWAVLGALVAMAGAVWTSSRLMRLADRILHGADHTPPGLAPERAERLRPAAADLPQDWHTFNAEIARSKRWAFYRRTRQFDRLAQLEAESKDPTA